MNCNLSFLYVKDGVNHPISERSSARAWAEARDVHGFNGRLFREEEPPTEFKGIPFMTEAEDTDCVGLLIRPDTPLGPEGEVGRPPRDYTGF